MTVEHDPDCPLNAVHWLRRAIAASGRLIAHNADEMRLIDRTAAEALADALAHFAKRDDWASVTLRDVALHANLLNDGDFAQFCTCGVATG